LKIAAVLVAREGGKKCPVGFTSTRSYRLESEDHECCIVSNVTKT
jgi:hypothetical protein